MQCTDAALTSSTLKRGTRRMVFQGQFLERAIILPVGSAVCEGVWHRGARSPPVLVLPPPPGEGGMDHVVAAELAWASAQAGHAELRFNFRGVGASQGARGNFEAQLEDAEAALALVLANTGGRRAVVAALGASAAMALALHERRPEVSGLALVNPTGIAVRKLARLGLPLLVIAAQHETASRLELAAAVLSARGTFEVVDSEDAVFSRNLPAVGHAMVAWLAYLSGD